MRKVNKIAIKLKKIPKFAKNFIKNILDFNSYICTQRVYNFT